MLVPKWINIVTSRDVINVLLVSETENLSIDGDLKYGDGNKLQFIMKYV